MFFDNFFGGVKTSVALFISVKTVGNIAKEAIKSRVIGVKITWVSNNRYPITKSSNRTPVIGQPHDHALIL